MNFVGLREPGASSMHGTVSYRQQVSYCGKARCRRCSEGIGHGPYWYAYHSIDGRTVRTYIGKELPPAIQATLTSEREAASSMKVSGGEEAMIRVYVLGQFRLERRASQGWQSVNEEAWQLQRVRSLLACLISSPGRRLRREQVMDILWPELDGETAAARLDRAVYSLRQLFEPTRSRLATSPLLLTGRDLIELAGERQVWVDADAFESLLNGMSVDTDAAERACMLEEAANLYGGDFLSEERALEAAIARRESLRRSWIGLLLELADVRAAHDPNSALESLHRILAVDPTNEAAVQRLIRLLAHLDRRGEALRVYKRLAAILRQEYQIAPLPETRALYDAVRLGARAGNPVSPLTVKEETVAMPGLQSGSHDILGPTGRSHLSPLVGREQELARLRALLAASGAAFKLPARQNATPLDTRPDPQTLLLMGDAGIGKTRLAEEMAREARGRGWTIAWGRVYPQETSIPYRLWIEVMRKAMERGTWRSELRKRPALYQPLTALIPELAVSLSQVTLPPPSSPAQEQLRLWEAIRELLTAISKVGPLFIVLDDIQWADSSSGELFAYLARRLKGLPIIIVGTYRENEPETNQTLRPLLTALQRDHAIATISLPPLSDEQIGAIVAYAPHVTEAAVQYIQMRAVGNPFFAEELARTLGASPPESAKASDQHGTKLPTLPDTISAALDLRMSRLTAPCRRLLSAAAVLGSSFELHHIKAMEAGADEDAVLDLVEEALQAGMLTEEGSGTDITYQFCHPLLVMHLYEKLSAARRASFHRRAAELLRREFQGREEEGAATITYHLIRGGAPALVIAGFAELAGRRAYTFSAYPDAEHHYCLAVDCLERALSAADPARDDLLHLASLLEFAAECSRLQGKDEDARRLYERTLELRRQLYASSRLVPEEAEIQALLWCEIALTCYDTGDTVQARRYCQQGEDILREAAVQAGAAWASIRFLQGYIFWREGNYAEAQRRALEALNLFEAMLNRQADTMLPLARSPRLRRALAGDPVEVGRTRVLLGLIANGAGRSATAITHWNAALALFEQYDRQREIAVVCCNLGDVHLRKAEHSLAQAFFQRSLQIAERIGEIPSASIALGNMGALALRSGDLSEAESWFRRGLRLIERVNDPVYTSMLEAYIGVAMQEQGKFAEARKHLSRALKMGHAMRLAPCMGLALVATGAMYLRQAEAIGLHQENGVCKESTRLLHGARRALQRAIALEEIEAETGTEGLLLLARIDLLLGHGEQAHERAARVLEEARRCELVWLLARARRVMGSILAAQDRQEQAWRYFEQALETFHSSGMHIEYARTLHEYGTALLRPCSRVIGQSSQYEQGLKYLREAYQILTDHKAVLDAQLVEHALSHYC